MNHNATDFFSYLKSVKYSIVTNIMLVSLPLLSERVV